MGEGLPQVRNTVSLACNPSGTAIERRISTAQAALRGATPHEVRHAMAPLLAINLSNTPPNWDLVWPIYETTLDDIPPDLLSKAVLDHIRESEWFPKPAQLRALASDELQRRRHDLEELQAEQFARNQPVETPRDDEDRRTLEEIAEQRRRQAPLWGEVLRVVQGGALRPFPEVLDEYGLDHDGGSG